MWSPARVWAEPKVFVFVIAKAQEVKKPPLFGRRLSDYNV
jgi:hypothetical protein